MKRMKKSFTDKIKCFNNNWQLEDKKIELCLKLSKMTTINKLKKKKPDSQKLNQKQNKFSKWEREKALEEEFPLAFICNNNKQKDFTKRDLQSPELEWILHPMWKERAQPEPGCDLSKVLNY